MASGRMHTVVRRLRQTALFDAGLDDGDLLERYLSCRDETAFAALVRRHGPMVLGVCRRILGNIHDADDAFQATFLILVRKAPSIFPRGQVGPWLYGVAYRTSLKSKAMSSRRRAKQQSLQDIPGPQPPAHDEWLELLDREVNRLPDKYRLPIVLCDLEGKTRKQAARQLGWPEGTVATRLQHGRALVQKRLVRHGLPLSAGAITLVWIEAISAASVPARLLASTVQTASVFSAGTLTGSIPLKVIALAQGVLHAMVISKVKNVSAILMMLGVLGLGLGGLTSVSRTAAAAQPPTDETQPTRSARPSEAKNAVDQTSAATFLDSGTVEHSTGRLPTGPPPVQALVSFAKGMVVVRTNQFYYEPRTVHTGNQAMTHYELRHLLRSDRYERDQVEVYDTRRRKLDNKDMPKWLKEEIPALVLVGSRELDPLHLRLIKDGTLIFVLPAAAEPPAMAVGTPPLAPDVNVSIPALGPMPLTVPQFPAQTTNVPYKAPSAEPRLDQAERELAIAEFYLKTGHRGSATFYYEMIQQRYAGTSYAKRAAQLLDDLRMPEKTPRSSQKTEARIGEIIIVGNKRVPDTIILEAIALYPGQVLNYKDVRSAEERLRAIKEFASASAIVNVRPTLSVVDSGQNSAYKDILVTINESLRLDVLAEFEKLNGTWIVTAASSAGKEIPQMIGGELIFAGDRLTSKLNKNSDGGRSGIILDLSAKPKTIRLTPIDGPAGASTTSGTYEFAGDHLKLTLGLERSSTEDSTRQQALVLTLRRRQSTGSPATTGLTGDTADARIRIENKEKSYVITAAEMSISASGDSVRLTDAAITCRPPGKQAYVLRGKVIVLRLNTAVRTIADLQSRQFVDMTIEGAEHLTAPAN